VPAQAKPSGTEQAFIKLNIDAVRRAHQTYGIPISVYFGVISAEMGLHNVVWKEKNAEGKEITQRSWWHIQNTNNYFNLANGTSPSERKPGMICNAQICFQTFADFEEAAIAFSETVCGYVFTAKKKANPYASAESYARSMDTDPSKFDYNRCQ